MSARRGPIRGGTRIVIRGAHYTDGQVTGYLVRRGDWNAPVTVGTTDHSYSDTTLAAGASYTCSVVAYADFNGTEADSAPASVTVTTPSAAGPGVPTDVSTGSVGTDTAANSCPATAGWVGPSIGSTRVAAYVTDPSPGKTVRADFHVVDLGGDGTGSATPLADAASNAVTGSGPVYVELSSDRTARPAPSITSTTPPTIRAR